MALPNDVPPKHCTRLSRRWRCTLDSGATGCGSVHAARRACVCMRTPTLLRRCSLKRHLTHSTAGGQSHTHIAAIDFRLQHRGNTRIRLRGCTFLHTVMMVSRKDGLHRRESTAQSTDLTLRGREMRRMSPHARLTHVVAHTSARTIVISNSRLSPWHAHGAMPRHCGMAPCRVIVVPPGGRGSRSGMEPIERVPHCPPHAPGAATTMRSTSLLTIARLRLDGHPHVCVTHVREAENPQASPIVRHSARRSRRSVPPRSKSF